MECIKEYTNFSIQRRICFVHLVSNTATDFLDINEWIHKALSSRVAVDCIFYQDMI